jgi:hypothetical protein
MAAARPFPWCSPHASLLTGANPFSNVFLLVRPLLRRRSRADRRQLPGFRRARQQVIHVEAAAVIPCVSSPNLQLHIYHSPVSSLSPANLVLLCSISSNHESRTLDKNKRGPCASLIKYSVEDFNRKSSSFRASSRNPKDRIKTKLAAQYSSSTRQIVWIGKSLPISWIYVGCENGKLINYSV